MEKTPLVYLREQLSTPDEPFVRLWGTLTEKDKADLRQYAEEEMRALGILKPAA